MNRLVIPGKPEGKGRAKIYNGHGVTPEGTVLYENLIKMKFWESKADIMEGPIALTIYAYYPIPGSKKKTEKELMRQGYTRPCKKPDVDNVAKVCMDALTGAGAWKDDKDVVVLTVAKFYSDVPRVEINYEKLP